MENNKEFDEIKQAIKDHYFEKTSKKYEEYHFSLNNEGKVKYKDGQNFQTDCENLIQKLLKDLADVKADLWLCKHYKDSS